MNIVLIEDSDLIGRNRVLLDGRRAQHIVNVLKAKVGDSIRAGRINGKWGDALVTGIIDFKVELEVEFVRPAPAPLPVTLLLALPRPKVLKRVLGAAVTMGVKEIFLFNSWRVDKSYWQTPLLKAEKLHEIALLALEQAVDTNLPKITTRPLFRPFAEDEVPNLSKDRDAWLMHPHSQPPPESTEQFTSAALKQHPGLIAIGPEGGFIPFEVELLIASGLKPVTFGPRIMRVEQAVPAALSRFII